MWNVEHQQITVLDSFYQIRDSPKVLRKLDSGEISKRVS